MDKLIIHATVNDRENAARYLPAIRRYSGASIGEIRRNIQNGQAAVSLDWFPVYNFDSDMGDQDVRAGFCKLVETLIELGADVSLHEQCDPEDEPVPITLQVLGNMIEREKGIARAIEWEDEQSR